MHKMGIGKFGITSDKAKEGPRGPPGPPTNERRHLLERNLMIMTLKLNDCRIIVI